VQVSVRKKPPGVNSFRAVGNIRKNVVSIEAATSEFALCPCQARAVNRRTPGIAAVFPL
jgi:hypothetical protein